MPWLDGGMLSPEGAVRHDLHPAELAEGHQVLVGGEGVHVDLTGRECGEEEGSRFKGKVCQ